MPFHHPSNPTTMPRLTYMVTRALRPACAAHPRQYALFSSRVSQRSDPRLKTAPMGAAQNLDPRVCRHGFLGTGTFLLALRARPQK